MSGYLFIGVKNDSLTNLSSLSIKIDIIMLLIILNNFAINVMRVTLQKFNY